MKGTDAMRKRGLFLLALMLTSCATGQPLRWPWEPSLAKVVGASMTSGGEQEERTVVTLMTDRPVEVMAYRLRKPDRVAVEIDGAVIDEGMAKGLASSGLVSRVEVFPFTEAEAVRVEMETVTYTDFDLDAEGTRVVLTLTPRLDQEKEELRRKLEEARVTIARMEEKATPTPEPTVEPTPAPTVVPTPEPTRTPIHNKADAPPVTAKEYVSTDERMLLDRVEWWRQAWESLDIDRYAEFYAADFKSDGYDRARWLERKGRIFSRVGKVSVGIIEPKGMIDGDMARVVFTQQYWAGRPFAPGWKELTFVREEGVWRIVAESWRRLQ